MPKASRTKSAPAENAGSGTPTPTASTGPTLDLSAWRTVPTAVAQPAADKAKPKVERPKRPEIGVEELSGIPGLLAVDVFEPPAHPKWGQSAGLVVRLPARDAAHPATDVLTFVNYRTVAGRAVRDSLTLGTLAQLDGTRPETFVPFTARAKMSAAFADGKPMVFLRFGEPVGTPRSA